MSKLLLLYSYKKYYNRIISRLETFQDYVDLITPGENTPAAYRGFVRDNVNFDYQDGVHAKHVINIKKEDPYYAKVEQPDYCVLEETGKDGENLVKKVSRYYVLEAVRTRGNQYELTLRRDLLADFMEDILFTPAFIERGNLAAYDPLIFNREGFTFNQIKKHELLLNFNKLSGKGKGWIVGYLNRAGTQETQNDQHATGVIDAAVSATPYANLPNAVKDTLNLGYAYIKTGSFGLFMTNTCWAGIGQVRIYNPATEIQFYGDSEDNFNCFTRLGERFSSRNDSKGLVFAESVMTNQEQSMQTRIRNCLGTDNTSREAIFNAISSWYDTFKATAQGRFDSSILNYDGLVYVKDNKYYKIHIVRNYDYYPSGSYYPTISLQKSLISAGSTDAVGRAMDSFCNYLIAPPGSTEYWGTYPNNLCPANENVVSYYAEENHYSSWVEEVGFDEIECSISKNRNKLLDAPYDIFCIPVGSTDIINNLITQFTTWDNIALPMARGIALLGTGIVSDVQLLPYCPFPEMINADGNIDITNFVEGKDYSYITFDNAGTKTNVGIILYPLTSRGTFDMTIPSGNVYYENYDFEGQDPIIKKVKAETQFARFTSPNFASSFDINIQKNEGIAELNVDYFYKPYSPYIHVAPYFKGLYGTEFNDPKGLICSGEFSIATAADKWEEYQIQNKNYELIFNRQIQNLDVNNAISMEQLKITSGLGIVSSALQGAAAGAVAGGMAGGPASPFIAAGGAVIGGLASGITSAIGREYDINFLARQQREARSYSVDMYTYQLGNIQALPNSLTRVSAFTENNKIFPFIEFYDSTEEEKEALRDKLLYNGMTVMRIGKVADYIRGDYNYVQGRLIRLIGIDEDNHVVAEIANELKEGAYFYGSDSE